MGAPPVKFGWLPDKPDKRDYFFGHPKVAPLPRADLPASISLRGDDTPIMNQLEIGSCTANAGCGLLQFLQKRDTGKYTPMSRLYLYRLTRWNMFVERGDTGASLRDTMMTMVVDGVIPELYWNYNIQRFEDTPTHMNIPGTLGFLTGKADNFEGIHYVRVDPDGANPLKVLEDIKTCIISKMPVIFGTQVFQQIMNVNSQGDIWAPTQGERPVGGHALMIVGYDDERTCYNTSSRGAFLVRNSWGTEWGDGGYGWLPYEYLMFGYAQDFWTLQGVRCVNTGDFV
jgi:C1A family cysteine protease